MAQLKVDVATNLAPLNEIIKLVTTLDEKVKLFGTQGGANLAKALAAVGSITNPLQQVSQVLQGVQKDVTVLQKSLADLERLRISKPFEELKTGAELPTLTGQVAKYIEQLKSAKSEMASFISTVRGMKGEQLSQVLEIVSPQQIQRVQQLKKELLELNRAEVELTTKRRSATAADMPAYTEQIEAVRRRQASVNVLTRSYSKQAADDARATLQPINSIFSEALRTLDATLSKVEDRFARISRLTKQEVPAVRPPTIEAETGRAYLAGTPSTRGTGFLNQVAGFAGAFEDAAVKILGPVFQTAEGSSRGGLESLNDKFARRMQGLSKAVSNLFLTPEFFTIVEQLDRGGQVSENQIRKFGNTLTKLMQFAQKTTSEYLVGVGEQPMVLSTGVTKAVGPEEAKVRLMSEYNRVVVDLSKNWAVLKERELTGMSTQGLKAKIDDLRTYRNYLVDVLQFAERKGITSVSAAEAVGPDVNVRMRHAFQGISTTPDMEAAFAQVLGYEQKATEEAAAFDRQIRQTVSSSQPLAVQFARAITPLESLKNLFTGLSAVPGRELESLLQVTRTLETVSKARAGHKIEAFDPEAMTVFEHLPTGIGKATGYAEREVAGTFSKIVENVSELRKAYGALDESGKLLFQGQMKDVTKLEESFRVIDLSRLQKMHAELLQLAKAVPADPEKNLGLLTTKAGLLSQEYEGVASAMGKIGQKGFGLAESVDIKPIVENFQTLRSLWAQPGVGKRFVESFDTEFRGMFEKFKGTGNTPINDLLILWQRVVEVVKKYQMEVEKASNQIASDPKIKNVQAATDAKVKALSTQYGTMFRDASTDLLVGFKAAESPISMMNAFQDSFKKLAFNSRDLFNVGVNASGILESTRGLAQLTSQAMHTGLDASTAPRFAELRKNIEQSTLVLKAEHLPILEKIVAVTDNLTASTKKWAGGSFLRTPRGALPEALTEAYHARTFADPYATLGYSLEEAPNIPKGEAYTRRFQKLGDEFIETYEVLGRRLKETPEKAIFPGQLEIVDLVGKKLQTMAQGGLGYTIEQLAQGKTQMLYEPSLPYLKTLQERLAVAHRGTQGIDYPEQTSLNLTVSRTSRALTMVQDLYQKLFEMVNSGKPITADFFKTFETYADRASRRFESGLIKDVDVATQKFRMFISEEDQAQSAIREALKIPEKVGGKPYGLAAIFGSKEEGGDKTLVESMGARQLARTIAIMGSEMGRTTEIVDPTTREMLQKRIFKITQDYLTPQRNLLQKAGEWPSGMTAEIRKEFAPEDQPFLQQFLKMRPSTKLASVAPAVVETETVSKLEQVNQRLAEIFGVTAETIAKGSFSTQEAIQQFGQMTPKALQKVISDLKVAKGQMKTVIAELFSEGTSPVFAANLQGFIPTIDAMSKAAEKSLKQARKSPEGRTVGEEAAVDIRSSLGQLISEETKIPGQIDKITAAKLAALLNQSTKMHEQMGKTGKEVGLGEQQVWNEVELAGSRAATGAGKRGYVGGAPVFEKGETADGKRQVVDLNNALNSVINRYAELSNQMDVFGYGLSRQGQPISAYAEAVNTVRLQVGTLIKDLSKSGGLVPGFDEMLGGGKMSAMWDKFQNIMKNIHEASEQYRASKHATTDLEGGVAAEPEQIVKSNKQAAEALLKIKQYYAELNTLVRELYSTENLTNEARSRGVAEIEQLAMKYKKVNAEAQAGLASPVAGLEQIKAAEEIARGSLVRAAWRGPQREGVFPIGVPAATEADVFSKFFDVQGLTSDRTANFAKIFKGQTVDVMETFRKINDEFSLGVPDPFFRTFNTLSARLQKVKQEIEESGPTKLLMAEYTRLAQALPQAAAQPASQVDAAETFRFTQQVYERLSSAKKELSTSQFKFSWAEEMQKGAEQVQVLQLRLNQLINAARLLREERAPVEVKIPAYEALNQEIVGSRQAYFKAQQDTHLNQATMSAFMSTIQEAESSQKSLLSLWDRLANTVKTTRNNLADLFMYQVRWYASMMVFWGIWNRISGSFENMMHAQFEIERATVNLRESSGEVLANYTRLALFAQPAIFEAMVKWGTTSKDAGEALYQLGSAGLSARESLAALSPVVAMAVGTQAELRETVKTVAGLYNVLKDSISSAGSEAGKFRVISDVLAMVFRDHQVEMDELNRGYQYSIHSAEMAGLSFFQLSAMLSVLNDNMVKGSRAGRAITDVISHLASKPYTVLASFKEMGEGILELNLGLTELQKRDLTKIMAGWTAPNIRKMSTFQMLEELSKMVTATGMEVDVLGRIFESFGILGGRGLVPLLKNFEKVRLESMRLENESAGTAEMMAERISATFERNLLKVSGWFQKTFYDSFIVFHSGTKLMLEAIGSVFGAVDGLATSVDKKLTASLGPVAGSFSGAFVNALPMVLGLAGGFGLLVERMPKLGNLFRNFGFDLATTLLTTQGLTRVFTGLGNIITAPAEAAVRMGASIKTVFMGAAAVTKPSAFEGATVPIIVTPAVQGLVPALKEIGSTASTAFRNASSAGMGFAAIFPALGSVLQAFGTALGTFWASNPVLFAILTITATIAGLTVAINWMFDSVDARAAKAEEAWGKFDSVMGKIAQKTQQRINQINSIVDTQISAAAAFSALEKVPTPGRESSTERQDAMREFRSLAVAVGDYTAAEQASKMSTTELIVEHAKLQQRANERQRSLGTEATELNTSTASQVAYSGALENHFKVLQKYDQMLKFLKTAREEGGTWAMFGMESMPEFTPWTTADEKRYEKTVAESLGARKDVTERQMRHFQTEIAQILSSAIKVPGEGITFAERLIDIRKMPDIGARYTQLMALSKQAREVLLQDNTRVEAVAEVLFGKKLSTENARKELQALIQQVPELDKWLQSLASNVGVQIGPDIEKTHRQYERHLTTELMQMEAQKAKVQEQIAIENARAALALDVNNAAAAARAIAYAQMERIAKEEKSSVEASKAKFQEDVKQHALAEQSEAYIAREKKQTEEIYIIHQKATEERMKTVRELPRLLETLYMEAQGNLQLALAKVESAKASTQAAEADKIKSEMELQLRKGYVQSREELEKTIKAEKDRITAAHEAREGEKKIEVENLEFQKKMLEGRREDVSKEAVGSDPNLQKDQRERFAQLNQEIAKLNARIAQAGEERLANTIKLQTDLNRAEQSGEDWRLNSLKNHVKQMQLSLGTLEFSALTSITGGPVFNTRPTDVALDQLIGKNAPEAVKKNVTMYVEKVQEILRNQGLGQGVANYVLALMRQESGFKQSAVSEAGALGLFQLLPSTAAGLGVDPKNWEQNIIGGIKYVMQAARAAGIDLRKLDSELPKDAWTNIIKTLAGLHHAGTAADLSQAGPKTRKHMEDVLKWAEQFQTVNIGGISTGSTKTVSALEMVAETYRKLTEVDERGKALYQMHPADARTIITDLFQSLAQHPTLAVSIGQSPVVKQLQDLGLKLKAEPRILYAFMKEGIRAMLEAGMPVSDELLNTYIYYRTIASERGLKKVTPKELRTEGLSFIKAFMEQDSAWIESNLDNTFEQITMRMNRFGLSGRQTYAAVIKEVLQPGMLEQVLTGNLDLTESYFRKWEGYMRTLLHGAPPIQLYKAFEKNISEILTSGEALTQSQLLGYSRLLHVIPTTDLAEASNTIVKHYHALAQRQELSNKDLSLMAQLMMSFGATSDEVWKGWGDSADQQLRRIRAGWAGVQGDTVDGLTKSQGLGDALIQTLIKGFADFGSKIKDPFKMMADSITSTLESARGTMEEIFHDFATRQPKSTQEYVNKFAEGISRAASKNLSEMVMGGFTNTLGSLLGLNLATPQKMPQMMASQTELQKAALTLAEENKEYNKATAINTDSIARSMGGGGLGTTPGAGGLPSSAPSFTSQYAGAFSGFGGAGATPSLGMSLLGMGRGLATPRGFSPLSPSIGVSPGSPESTGFWGTLKSLPLIGPIFGLMGGIGNLFGKMFGQNFGLQSGGPVPGYGSGDSVPAMLEPGEFVFSRDAVKAAGGTYIGVLHNLLRRRGRGYQGGGEISSDELQDMMSNTFSNMFAPYRDMLDPERRKFANIGEGFYGPEFEKQTEMQRFADAAKQADFNRKMSEYNASVSSAIASEMAQPSALQIMFNFLKMLPSAASLGMQMSGMGPGSTGSTSLGKASGGLIPQMFQSGGIPNEIRDKFPSWYFAKPGSAEVIVPPDQKAVSGYQTILMGLAGFLMPLMQQYSARQQMQQILQKSLAAQQGQKLTVAWDAAQKDFAAKHPQFASILNPPALPFEQFGMPTQPTFASQYGFSSPAMQDLFKFQSFPSFDFSGFNAGASYYNAPMPSFASQYFPAPMSSFESQYFPTQYQHGGSVYMPGYPTTGYYSSTHAQYLRSLPPTANTNQSLAYWMMLLPFVSMMFMPLLKKMSTGKQYIPGTTMPWSQFESMDDTKRAAFFQERLSAYKIREDAATQGIINPADMNANPLGFWARIKGFFGFQTGGKIPGVGHGDTVPAWLTPGEFVVNRGTVDFFGPRFFYDLQNVARQQKASATHLLSGALHALPNAQHFAAGGAVTPSTMLKPVRTAGTKVDSSSQAPINMTMVTVIDEDSLDQFLNSKKYGDVLVNRLGSRITRRMTRT